MIRKNTFRSIKILWLEKEDRFDDDKNIRTLNLDGLVSEAFGR